MNDKSKNELIKILSGFVILVTVLMIAQDYLTSIIFNTSYYLSESLLFKTTIAVLFLPIVIFKIKPFKVKEKEINISKVMVFLIPICIIHILISSLLIAFISKTFLSSSFSFWFLIQNKFTNNFVFILTIYGLMYLIIRYYSLNIINKDSNQANTIALKNGKHTDIVTLLDIDWISAETPYVGIYVGGKKYLYHTTLVKIQTELNDKFVRIHRSTIVNSDKIKSIKSRSNGDYDIILYNDKQLRLSRNYRDQINQTHLKF